MARIEGSKSFFRGVVESLDPNLVPRYEVFTEYTIRVDDFIASLGDKVVIKKDSTVSGPRVRIYDLANGLEEALKDAKDWIQQDGKIVVEEFFEGKEVAIMSFTDGRYLVHSPPFRNHKRIYDGDEGENTSGMGTLTTGEYLPFMTKQINLRMQGITEQLLGWIRSNHESN